MSTPEGSLKKKAYKILDAKAPYLWYYPAQDRYTSGILDIVGCYLGFFFSIELKRPGENPRPLQEITIDKIRRSGGLSLSVDNLEDIMIALRLIEIRFIRSMR